MSGGDDDIRVGPPRLDAPADFVKDGRLPKGLQVALSNPDRSTLCGGRFTVETSSGTKATTYCAEPRCITEGVCTGAMFVPHIDQWNESDVLTDAEGNPLRTLRKMTPQEIVKAVRMSARAATGKDDPRTDDEIAKYVGRVWRKLVDSIRGRGGWGPGPESVS